MATETPSSLAESTAFQLTEQTVRGGINIMTGTLFLEGEVNSEMATTLARQLHILSFLGGEITIYFSSPGGDLAAGFAMYDLIKACPSSVTMIGYGEIMSAGVLILQAADKRLLMPNCSVMVHIGYGQTGMDLPENVVRQAESIKDATQRAYKLLAERIGISVKDMHDLYKFDTFVPARKAVQLGLADAVFRR